MNTRARDLNSEKQQNKKKKNLPKAVYDVIFYRSVLLIITGRRACVKILRQYRILL